MQAVLITVAALLVMTLVGAVIQRLQRPKQHLCFFWMDPCEGPTTADSLDEAITKATKAVIAANKFTKRDEEVSIYKMSKHPVCTVGVGDGMCDPLGEASLKHIKEQLSQ